VWPGHVRGLPSGGCGDSSAEREFPSHRVYRRNDRGIVGVESFGLQGLAFFGIHTSVGRAVVTVPRLRIAALVPEVLTALPSVWSSQRSPVSAAYWSSMSSISNSTSGIEVGDLAPVVAGSACLGERRNETGSGLLASVAQIRDTIERYPRDLSTAVPNGG
jgi:hypothetical protein